MTTAATSEERLAPAEVTGLTSAQSYAAGMTDACTAMAAQTDQFMTLLAGEGVEGSAVAAVARANVLTQGPPGTGQPE